ncbi:protein-ER retention protein [Yamadazyma tenuis]|nr:protein-ER retention protein [Yamadazyma tenuis]
MLIISYKIFSKPSDKSVGKLRLSTTMKRILSGNINSKSMRTNDILISDSLVSYSKVLNDIGIFIWHYFVSDELPYNSFLELFVLCLPALIRIRQCWQEFLLTRQRSHMLNLMKYTTGIAPIFINFLIKFNVQEYGEDNDAGKEMHLHLLKILNVWWYLCSFINSTYSFIWDVRMDWGFETFDYFLKKSSFTLRSPDKLIYRKPIIYYSGITVDFLLRYIWVLKFYTQREAEDKPIITRVGLFLFGYDAFSFGYSLIEVLEIFRRFMWCFFKLENDWFKLDPQYTTLTNNVELMKMG